MNGSKNIEKHINEQAGGAEEFPPPIPLGATHYSRSEDLYLRDREGGFDAYWSVGRRDKKKEWSWISSSRMASCMPIVPVKPLGESVVMKNTTPRMSAPMMLERAANHIADRARTRDQLGGERTMGQCVNAFNAIYGTALTEEQGWQFMTLLKMVRGANGKVNPDDYEDGAAYFALAGEAALSERS